MNRLLYACQRSYNYTTNGANIKWGTANHGIEPAPKIHILPRMASIGTFWVKKKTSFLPVTSATHTRREAVTDHVQQAAGLMLEVERVAAAAERVVAWEARRREILQWQMQRHQLQQHMERRREAVRANAAAEQAQPRNGNVGRGRQRRRHVEAAIELPAGEDGEGRRRVRFDEAAVEILPMQQADRPRNPPAPGFVFDRMGNLRPAPRDENG